MKTTKVGVRLTDEDLYWLKTDAKAKDQTISDVIRASIAASRPTAEELPDIKEFCYVGDGDDPLDSCPSLKHLYVFGHPTGYALVVSHWLAGWNEQDEAVHWLDLHYCQSLEQAEQYFSSFDFTYHWGSQAAPEFLDTAPAKDSYQVYTATEQVIKAGRL